MISTPPHTHISSRCFCRAFSSLKSSVHAAVGYCNFDQSIFKVFFLLSNCLHCKIGNAIYVGQVDNGLGSDLLSDEANVVLCIARDNRQNDGLAMSKLHP